MAEHCAQRRFNDRPVSREAAPPRTGVHATALNAAPRVAQLREAASALAPRANRTGLPDRLKHGVERLSGMAMDHVRVHYNSPEPAQLMAHAYTQGADIHVGPGQEAHLGHEAWHVVQQAEGRVPPTTQLKGVAINDQLPLEAEADRMGARAWAAGSAPHAAECGCAGCHAAPLAAAPVQRVVQRLCNAGHPYHPDGPCPFEAIDTRPRRQGGGNFRSIYTTPQSDDTDQALAQHQSQFLLGSNYLPPVEVLHAPATPMPQHVPRRDPAQTGTAFQLGTGHDSAREHMESQGYESGPRRHHRTHIGGYGQHGPIADNPDNIVAASGPINGLMTTVDGRYPPGYINLNEAEVQPGTRVAHRIHQAVAHPDAPNTPLFRLSHDAQQPLVTGGQWDAQQQWAQQRLTAENLENLHLLQNLSPGSWPTMDQLRDEDDSRRVAEALDAMRRYQGQ
ncbi:hypothetical protein FHS95_001810 [Sphingomonas naasensis]|uniref:DUF4157 domain-containing protein n=1 Tax=Sphingomonas naasensis TaxID=1344951 RepID=A0A4S1WLY0_9SPHN|nr:DUF4157 domain-containing protein [Sphingomonas naasensis]NIJ20118.1 hypothetical protein [Sphingomonas naasensis]TGX44271.1 DUF4157 domain-containing protein [Sphingomonas naasensis]